MCLISAAARSPIYMNLIYDELVYNNNEHFIDTKCLLLTPALSSFLNWNVAYAQDNNTSAIIKALVVGKSSKISSTVIDKVHKSYRDHL